MNFLPLSFEMDLWNFTRANWPESEWYIPAAIDENISGRLADDFTTWPDVSYFDGFQSRVWQLATSFDWDKYPREFEMLDAERGALA